MRTANLSGLMDGQSIHRQFHAAACPDQLLPIELPGVQYQLAEKRLRVYHLVVKPLQAMLHLAVEV